MVRPVPPRQEGRFAIVTNVRRDAVDVDVPKTKGRFAYGEVVWSRRPDAGVKPADDAFRITSGDGGNSAWLPEESAI